MENLRYLLAVLSALTLIMSVVSSVNPSYFAGLNAFASYGDDDEEDDDDNSSSTSNHEDDEENDDQKESDEDERKLEQPLGNHSKATLEVDEDAELEVEIEDGDLDDGLHDVVFACDNPSVNKEFSDSLNVTEGSGEFDADLGLSNDTYTGCEVNVGALSAAFPTFTLLTDVHDDKDDQDEEDDDENEKEHDDKNCKTEDEDEAGDNDVNDEEDEDDATEDEDETGTNNVNDEEECDDDGSKDDDSDRGSTNQDSAEEKHKERQEKIVSTTSGEEVHKRHRNASPHSPGDYNPGWNFTLVSNGTAMNSTDSDLSQEEDVTVNLNMSVWKSTSAIILLDVINGTVEIADQDFTVRIGYAFYSTQHDAMKIVALATDDDGNVVKLKLRGGAIDEADAFPMESGSIDLTFGGTVEDWNLLLEGTVEAD